MRTLAHCPVSEDEAYEVELKEPRSEAADRAFERRYKMFSGAPKLSATRRVKQKTKGEYVRA
jgi:hypothetical protein